MLKKITSLALIAAMSFSILACGNKDSATSAKEKKANISAYEVVTNMADASAEVNGIDAEISVDLDAEIKDEESQKFVVKGTAQIKGTADMESLYASVDAHTEMGEANDLKAEAYISKDDSDYTAYFGGDALGGWMKMPLKADELGVDTSKASLDELTKVKDKLTEEKFKKYFDNMTVIEKKVDGENCYVVKGNISSEIMKDFEKEMSDYAGDELGISDTTCDLELVTSVKTGLVKELSLEVNTKENEKIKLSQCKLSMKYNSYDVDAIQVPDEVIEEAIDMSSLY